MAGGSVVRVLLAIAHYAQPTIEAAERLTRCLIGWRGLAESGVQDFGGPCLATRAHQLDILVVDDGQHTAREYVPMGLAAFASVDGDSKRLPLECRRLLDERRQGYDLLGYSEHDNWPTAPDFFARVHAAQTDIPSTVLIPHRFERIAEPPYKVYIDGENGWGAYGAMWAVTAAQWAHWRELSHFLEYADQFAGPLESGCAWSLMQAFRCEKVEGLESEHAGERYARRSVGRGLRWE
jgi:hypothetical protein